eukprot:3608286-Karenia_brevis.AAC.1
MDMMRKALEEWMTKQAMQDSVAGNEAKAKEIRESVALVNERLSGRGRRRVETEALGRCQFISVQQSGNLDMSVAQLRET